MTYFQIVKNALDYPSKRMLVKQGNGISLLGGVVKSQR